MVKIRKVFLSVLINTCGVLRSSVRSYLLRDSCNRRICKTKCRWREEL